MVYLLCILYNFIIPHTKQIRYHDRLQLNLSIWLLLHIKGLPVYQQVHPLVAARNCKRYTNGFKFLHFSEAYNELTGLRRYGDNRK